MGLWSQRMRRVTMPHSLGWSSATGPGWSLCRRGLFHLRPEVVFAEPPALAELLAGALEDSTELWRVGHQEVLDLVVVLDADDNRDRRPLRVTATGPLSLAFRKALSWDLTSATDAIFMAVPPPRR